MIIFSENSASILVSRLFKVNEPYKYEAQQWNAFHIRKFNQGNEAPELVFPHVPKDFHLAGFIHWYGVEKPNQIVVFENESLPDIKKFVDRKHTENAGIMWYFIPPNSYNKLKKEMIEMEIKAQADKIRLARAREQKERTAKLAKKMSEKESLMVNTDDDFEEKDVKSCCCSCWWR
jgi:hypothetical protein